MLLVKTVGQVNKDTTALADHPVKTVIKVPLVHQVLKVHVVVLVQPVPLVITDPKVL